MGNMSYCRFSNTLEDLEDCYNNMDKEGLSEEEVKARRELIVTCRNLSLDYEDELDFE